MKEFAYMTARSIETARDAARRGGAFFAGGIDLLGEMKEYLIAPETVVNIKTIEGLESIEEDDRQFVIGTNVRLAPLAAHPAIRASLPGLAEAAGEVGSPQIRHVATVGGNLAQHSRCWYYRHRDVDCLKNGGARCYAREGESRYHAVTSGNPCISPVVSNLAVALAALGATVVVQRDAREPARLTIAELYQKAWDNPLAHNSLAPSDLILRVEIPKSATRSAYLQVSEKSDFDWALVSCAAAARVEGGVLRDARIALGAVAPVPLQSDAANALLEGRKPADAAEAAADALLEGATPRPDNAYKIPIARALIKRALLKLTA